MPTEKVVLSEKQAQFIRQSVDEGQYRDSSDVVRAGLRLLEQHEREDKLKLRVLRQLANDGFKQIKNGEYEDVEPGSIDQFMARIRPKVSKSKSR